MEAAEGRRRREAPLVARGLPRRPHRVRGANQWGDGNEASGDSDAVEVVEGLDGHGREPSMSAGSGPSEAAAPGRSGLEPIDVGDGAVLGVTHLADVTAVLEVYVMDVYECRTLPRGALVVDLGAGIGDFAVRASRQVGPDGRVIAVEPNPDDFEMLERNLRENGCRNATAVQGVVTTRRGPVPITFKYRTFEARAISLEELLASAGVTLGDARAGRVALKVDIEGAEVDALEELRPLVGLAESVAIELHGTLAPVDALLVPLGFRFHRLTRGAYLSRSFRFVVRHPRAGVRLWQRYRALPGRTPVRKMVGGIDIAASERLRVGVYRRTLRAAR